MNNEPLIQLKGVSKSFGQNVVLDEVDLTIYPGEALALLVHRELVNLQF